MQQNLSKSRIIATAALILCCSLLATHATAQNCSNSTLQGAYGYHANGVILPAPNISLQFQSVGVTHFTGDGHLTWVEHTVVGGVLLGAGWTSAKGTYTVNSNCSGTMVVVTPNSPVPLHFGLIIVKDGKEMHTVLNSDSVAAEYTKIDE